MKLTALQEYGLRCMTQMSRDPQARSTRIAEIAEAEALSFAYVAKLMRSLRQKGFVESIRGVKGGYRLIRAPHEIRVAEVLEALGGRIHPSDFCRRHAGHRKTCVHILDCSGREMFRGLDRVVHAYLEQFTLADLIKGAHEIDAVVTDVIAALPSLVGSGHDLGVDDCQDAVGGC